MTATFDTSAAAERVGIKSHYGNFIGGEFVPPMRGQFFTNITPLTGRPLCEVPRSTADDINLALDAAHVAAPGWGRTSPADRARVLNRIADRIEDNLELLATVETLDNGKPIRETRAADLPLAIDQFRYFASCIRSHEGNLAELDDDTVAYHFHEPLGVVAQIITSSFPLLMAAWKVAPALAAGDTVVLKPSEKTPLSVLVLAELIAHLLPAGVLNIVNGFGSGAGKPLASSPRVAKVSFTGRTITGRHMMEYASRNLVSPTLSLDGKSSNIFFADVMETNDEFLDKALEGFTLFAFNQGEVSACPSRALIQESIYDGFIERAIARTTAIRMGHPLDPRTMIGALVSEGRLRQTLSYIDIAKEEGARLLAGGKRRVLEGELAGGFYVAPTIFAGTRAMRVFHEEIPGPVLTVTTFKTPEEALSLANDTMFGLGAGVWTRDATTAYRMARGIRAGRIWTNCYHLYPAHAAFGGYKQSGAGREMHKMALGEYQQTKSVLVSYSPKALGLFEDRRGGSGR